LLGIEKSKQDGSDLLSNLTVAKFLTIFGIEPKNLVSEIATPRAFWFYSYVCSNMRLTT